MRVKIFLLTIFLQLIIVIFLGLKIKTQQKQVLGTSVSPILKSALIFPNSSKYKYFFEPKPNSKNVENLQWMGLNYSVLHTINADGLNQVNNYFATKSAGTYRIIAIGDSFTFGAYVNTEENYPSQLEKKLNENLKCKNINKFEVLNLGGNGYDIAYTVERYKLRGQKYNPDLVLWLLINDDLYRADEQMTPKSEYYDKQLKKSGQYEKFVKEGKFYQGWFMAEHDLLKEAGGKDALFKLQLSNLNNIKPLYDGQLVILTSHVSIEPGVSNILEEFTNNRKNTYYYDNLPNIYSQKNFYLPDLHPSAKGYTVYVDDLYNYLTKNNIIPCQKP
jgi:hypothetical protein